MVAFIPFPRCFNSPDLVLLDPFFRFQVRSSSNAAIVSMPPAEVLCAAARCNGVQSSAARPHVDTCSHVECLYMGVSKNGGTPKWMVKIIGKPYQNLDDFGEKTHHFWKHPYLVLFVLFF